MYAAIEDPNQHHVDLYTSGSETYAQIQLPPNSNSITIAVEINNEAPVVANAATAPLARHQVVEEDGNNWKFLVTFILIEIANEDS